MSTKERPVCSISKFGKDTLITQHLYRCESCHFSAQEMCCEECAKFCHQAHKLTDLGYTYGYCSCGRGCSKCHCFIENPVPGDSDIPPDVPRQCTFRESGAHYKSMDLCHCERCGFTGSAVICVPCAMMCHKDHNPSEKHHSSGGYCDCGDPNNDTFDCLLAPPSNPPEPIPVCTALQKPDEEVNQTRYICKTCNMEYLCEACAKKCHAGHNIEKVTDRSFKFVCQCPTKECVILQEKEPAA